MSAPAAVATRSAPAARDSGYRRTARVRVMGLLLSILVLVVVAALSIAVGTKSISLGDVWHYLGTDDGSQNATIVRDQRVPRTLLGLVAGAALGLAGALMQALTRNPLADPGVLGVNAGAAAAVVSAISFLSVSSTVGYVWFALLGAAIASVLVYALSAGGNGAATPVRLALAGTALTAVLYAYVSAVVLTHIDTFDQYRFWQVGSLAGRGTDVLEAVVPFIAVGAALALLLSRSLNAFALGEDTGRALGAHLGRTRIVGALAITLLCGAATAGMGPIVFVGLVVPHIARALTGPDQRWLLPYSMVLAPVLLLGADIVGRIIARPSEMEVGIVTAFLGAPVFIWLVRRRRVSAL